MRIICKLLGHKWESLQGWNVCRRCSELAAYDHGLEPTVPEIPYDKDWYQPKRKEKKTK